MKKSVVRFLIRIIISEGTWLNLKKPSKIFFKVFQDFVFTNEEALRRGLANLVVQA